MNGLSSWLAILIFAQAAPQPTSHAQVASHARHQGARLTWARGQGADTCVGHLGLTEDVKARLGWDPFVLSKELEIEGTVTKTPDGYRADLWLRDAAGKTLGKRKLESRARDCGTLGQAVATTITVAIDPDVSGAVVPSGEETAMEPEPSPAPPSPPAPRDDARASHIRVVAAGGVTGGLVPGPSDVIGLRAGLVIADVVEVGVGMSFFRESREGDFGFGLTAGELRACLGPWGARGLARLCGALLAGAFTANVRSADLTPLEVGTFAWVGAELGPVFSIAVAGPLRLEVGASAIAPIVRRQGFFRGAAAPAWEQATIAGRLELGLALLF